jgi:hypothetical protein
LTQVLLALLLIIVVCLTLSFASIVVHLCGVSDFGCKRDRVVDMIEDMPNYPHEALSRFSSSLFQSLTAPLSPFHIQQVSN